MALVTVGCAPDAVKTSADKMPGTGNVQVTAAELDKLPALTSESINEAFRACGLPQNFTESGNAFSASLTTPGPLVWVHQASGCTLGFGTETARVTVTPALALSGPFLSPVVGLSASMQLQSGCDSKFSNLAAADAAAFQRTISLNVLPVDARAERIGSVGPWKKSICSMTAVKGLTHTYKTPGPVGDTPQSFRVSVEFVPAVPFLPVAQAAVNGSLGRELEKGLQFEKITARITASNDPRLPVGRETVGSVTVELVPARKVIVDPNSRTQTELRTDLGVRVVANFSSAQLTQAMGLFPWAEYFIERGAGAVRFMSIASPDVDPSRHEILYK